MHRDPRWRALADEAGLAAEHLAIGASALSDANYAHRAHYAQAFFALSIGLERSAKLAFVVSHALENQGAFPSEQEVRRHCHRLRELLELADGIAERYGVPPDHRLPRTDIHEGIVAVLHDFASNVTRYFNFDLVTGSPKASAQGPIAAWHEKVVVPILAKHYTERHRARVEGNAAAIDSLLGGKALVRFTHESGAPLDTPSSASRATGEAAFATPYSRMYVLQFARFFNHLMYELTYASHAKRLDVIPALWEFYGVFNNPDQYLRKRKRWSTH